VPSLGGIFNVNFGIYVHRTTILGGGGGVLDNFSTYVIKNLQFGRYMVPLQPSLFPPMHVYDDHNAKVNDVSSYV
jgi:hypothetical protein